MKNNAPLFQVIDQWLKYQVTQGEIPGLQVAIRKKGKLVFNKAYGFSNIEKKQKYTVKHLGRIASQSKTISAAITLWLCSTGKLKLTEKVVNVLPDFKAHTDSRFKKISIIDLLSHRSGLHRDSFLVDYWGAKGKFLKKNALIKEVLQTHLIYNPGQFTKYSNLNFGLLGLVLEEVCGMPYESISKAFFKEMGLTQLPSDFRPNLNMAQGYVRKHPKFGTFRKISHPQVNTLAPAAGYYANAETLSKFYYKLYCTNQILPKKQRRLMMYKNWPVMNATDRYGFGTIFYEVGKHQYVGHSGGFPGFTSNTFNEVKTGYTFCFITNSSMAKSFNVIHGLAEIIRIIEENFKGNNKGNNKVIVSPPMADNFLSTIYIIDKTKALALPILGWNLAEDAMLFRKHKDYFVTHKISGFKNVGEPLRINYKSKKIVSIQVGGFKSKQLNLR